MEHCIKMGYYILEMKNRELTIFQFPYVTNYIASSSLWYTIIFRFCVIDRNPSIDSFQLLF